jgi:transcriptional regulator with XRE-family HTH domain
MSPTNKKDPPGKTDHQIGTLIKERRLILGYNQQELAQALNVSYQQIQKYEQGKNRLNLNKVQTACDFLGLDIHAIVDLCTERTAIQNTSAIAEDAGVLLKNLTLPEIREAQRLLSYYFMVKQPNQRKIVFNTVKNCCAILSSSSSAKNIK